MHMASRSIQETPSTQRSPLGLLLDDQGRRPSWLAKKLAVNKSVVTRWCTGERRIPRERVRQIADAIGVEPEEFAA